VRYLARSSSGFHVINHYTIHSGSLSLSGLSLKRRSQAASSGQAAFSASMGGGVVGIKNSSAGTGTRKIERGHSTGSIIPVATTSTPSHKTANNESLLD
jgi:hypothetical protein